MEPRYETAKKNVIDLVNDLESASDPSEIVALLMRIGHTARESAINLAKVDAEFANKAKA